MICPWQQIHNAKLSMSGKSEHATGRTPNLMCHPVMLITGNKFINLYSISVLCYSRSSISMLICQSGGQPWVFFIDSRKHLANAISNIIFRPGFVNSSNENWCLFVWLYRDTWFLIVMMLSRKDKFEVVGEMEGIFFKNYNWQYKH